MSFRREKSVPFGGPDGGDGGRGGDVVFVVKENAKTLSNLKMRRVFKAQNGQPGMGAKCHGKDGASVIIQVPPGTVIRDRDTMNILKDFSTTEETSWVFLRGGRGGQGNWHFRTAKNQAPRYAQPGIPGEHTYLRLELNIIADIGFVGFPNAGKSTLLSLLTNAQPKIANYAFTTIIPNLGVCYYKGKDIVLADIPGIIEGASEGAGLGFQFLKHVTRTRGLLFLVDLSDDDYLEKFPILLRELEEFSPELAGKTRILLGSKTDLDESGEKLAELRRTFPDETIYGISILGDQEIESLKKILLDMVLAEERSRGIDRDKLNETEYPDLPDGEDFQGPESGNYYQPGERSH